MREARFFFLLITFNSLLITLLYCVIYPMIGGLVDICCVFRYDERL
jgi:hypothetical protein